MLPKTWDYIYTIIYKQYVFCNIEEVNLDNNLSMVNNIKNVFTVLLSILVLSQVFFGLSGRCQKGRYQLFSDLMVSVNYLNSTQQSENQDLPINGSRDLDPEELEKEKEDPYIRYFQDTLEIHYIYLSSKALILDDKLDSIDPLEVIVPPPDLIV